MSNQSIINAFGRFWVHVLSKDKDILDQANSYTDTEVSNKVATLTAAIDGKSDSGHSHDDVYYTETEIDNKVATSNANGFMSSTDKVQIDSIEISTTSEIQTYLGY